MNITNIAAAAMIAIVLAAYKFFKILDEREIDD